jgi:lipopolysaccharide transport system ATP-binding protein
MLAIEVKNISKKFRIPREKKYTLFQHIVSILNGQGGNEVFWALKGVSFEVEKGETFGIIGKNGSGKSTLLKILARVLYPEDGSMSVYGRVASFLELGVGFQPELSARENVYLYSYILGLNKKQIDKSYENILEFSELRRFQNLKLKNFSTGMQLRLAFSTAIHANPEILLIDEVLAVGDGDFQKKCLSKINELKNNGKTIIFVSHNLDTIRELCTRSILLKDGIVTKSGPTSEVINYYVNVFNH